MASAHSRSIIVIDDDIEEVDDDLEILEDHGSFYSSTSQATKPKSTAANAPRQTAFAGQHTQALASKTSFTSPSFNASIAPTFRSLNWGSKAHRLANTTLNPPTIRGRASHASSRDNRPRQHTGSFARSLSPTSKSWMSDLIVGTAEDPIDLAEGRCKINGRNGSAAKYRFIRSGSYSLVPKRGATQRQKSILLDDDERTDTPEGEERSTALARSLTRHPRAYDELIDLESIEDDFFQDDGQGLQVQDVYLRDANLHHRRRSSQMPKLVRRNPSIVHPFQIIESIQHQGSTLIQNKTVELHDGSFLRIKNIIFNAETNQIKLRGHRLQRARDMNGMLEKKINECLLFFEVDVDDPRDLLEQSAVEIPLVEVARLRSVRFTNERFPLHRNADPKEYANKDAVLQGGGLTARWKYTCTYASAVDRYNNVFKERTMERVREDECSKYYSVSDTSRRFKWRGETIPGGAYQPTINKEEAIFLSESREGSSISIGSSPEPDDFALVHFQSIDDSGSDEGEDFQLSSMDIDSCRTVTKRKHSDMVMAVSAQAFIDGHGPKKPRRAEEEFVKATREGISRMSLQPGQNRRSKTRSNFVDLSGSRRTSSRPQIEDNFVTESREVMSRMSLWPDERGGSRKASKLIDLSSLRQTSFRPSLPRTIDLTSSDLSTPPDHGSIRTKSRLPMPPVVRTAGQKLTYGDAFCGAGGSSRGATMAGLRILWGFDFWKQACETWSTNFPYAKCYNKPAHKFVELAKRSEEKGLPDLMKVDILHLSPPCQFFSPAHTVNGVDDEMNTASLFAVQAVIEVSRARVVTLEQTFGIACPRFRFYFNALIQMFTTHDFSIRWAIVPLAQWGLPQRRNRLIIIASCPGEILPKMPAATHSETGQPPLKPYTSVKTALSSIPKPSPFTCPDPLHRPSLVEFTPHKHLAPWDDNKILPRAMTTSGGQNYHPSGTRDLTPREYATLQGFPNCHVFKGSYMKKQIGNAVPPCVAKVLFESIKRDLDAVDGIVEEAELIE